MLRLLWEAALLGALQGITEFLPISSSAHLALLPQMARWSSPLLNSLAFDVALHVGTLVALAAYFWKDLVRIVTAWFSSLSMRPEAATADSRLGWYILAATIPAVIAAVLAGDQVETTFRNPAVIALCLMGAGLVLAAAEYWSKRLRTLSDMTIGRALVIGVAQIFALIPGVSRSGVTITAGLALEFKREDAARFSFYMSLPAIAGAVVFKLKSLLALHGSLDLLAVGVGLAAAGVTGWLSIHWLLTFLRRHSVYIFVIYRLAFGTAVLVWWWSLSH